MLWCWQNRQSHFVSVIPLVSHSFLCRSKAFAFMIGPEKISYKNKLWIIFTILPTCNGYSFFTLLFKPQKYSFVVFFIFAKLYDLSRMLGSHLEHAWLEIPYLNFLSLNVCDSCLTNTVLFGDYSVTFLPNLVKSCVAFFFEFPVAILPNISHKYTCIMHMRKLLKSWVFGFARIRISGIRTCEGVLYLWLSLYKITSISLLVTQNPAHHVSRQNNNS